MSAHTRYFATIQSGRWGDRQVHYRRAGRGPALLMLHQSPQSSRDLIPLIESWSSRFTVIAPDTPGYGLSDPLGVTEASMDDFAAAVVEFLDAVGIEDFGVYGFHTGAGMAVALANRLSERTRAVVANGYVVLTDAEARDILAHYLPPFEPRWDGGHLTWLWARMREQQIFFPWHARHAANRMDFDLSAPEKLQEGVVEFMRAGDNYRVAYRAAFEYDSRAALTALGVPAFITAADPDPLSAHLARISEKSASVAIEPGGTAEATLAKSLKFLLRHPAAEPPPAPATGPLTGRTFNEMVNVPGGQLRVRRNVQAGGRTVVVQHDAAGSSDVVDPVSRSLIGHRPVLAVDLPGHGESDNTMGEEDVTVARYQDVVQQALDALGLDEIDFYGMWGGGLVGLEMAVTSPDRVNKLVMSDVIYHSDAERQSLIANYTPLWKPVWYGGHLLMIWHMMRDQGLFWPWFRRERAGILWGEPYIDPAMVNGRVLEVFKAPVMWRLAYQSHFTYPTHERLQQVAVPTLLCAPEWDPNYGHTEAAHAAAPQTRFAQLPPALDDWGPAFVDFLNE